MLIPTGEFLCGALRMKSNVELHLESGAVLKGSPRLADYILDGVRRGLLYAYEEKNIHLSGYGVIDGNGTRFFDPQQPHACKLARCLPVLLSGLIHQAVTEQRPATGAH